MKKIAFVTHDIGGCEAIYPVFKKLESNSILFTLGPSASKFPANAIDIDEVETVLQRMFDDSNLSGVVMGRNWGTDLDVRLLSWTHTHRIKSIVILDYWSNYAVSFRDDEKQYWPDAYFVMDDLALREASDDGVPVDIMRVVGHPGLDKFCEIRAGGGTFDKDILFLSQPLSVLYGDTLGFTECSVLMDIDKACQTCGRRFDVKFHPKDDCDFKRQYQSIAVDGDVDELMKHYQLIIGMSTMALLHAALMQIPVISYQPNLRTQDGCITNKLGISRSIYQYEDLLKALSDMSKKDVLSKPNQRPIWMDGNSTMRVVKALREILEI